MRMSPDCRARWRPGPRHCSGRLSQSCPGRWRYWRYRVRPFSGPWRHWDRLSRPRRCPTRRCGLRSIPKNHRSRRSKNRRQSRWPPSPGGRTGTIRPEVYRAGIYRRPFLSSLPSLRCWNISDLINELTIPIGCLSFQPIKIKYMGGRLVGHNFYDCPDVSLFLINIVLKEIRSGHR